MYVADSVITIEHKMVHEGNFYTANYVENALANDAFMRLHIKTDAQTYCHFNIVGISGGDAFFKTYTNSVYSNSGTLADNGKLTKFNRNAVSTRVRYNPTVQTYGTLRANTLFLGGTGGNSVGATSGERIESIIGPNTDILFELQNKAGQAKNFAALLDWYEVKK